MTAVNEAAHATLSGNARVDANHSRWVMCSLAATSVLLTPVAFWWFGPVGIGLVATCFAVIAVSYWAAHWSEARYARADRIVSGLLVASGIRMAVPLVAALLIVVVGRRFVSVESVLLLVPLYLSVLLVDTIFHVRPQAQDANSSGRALPTIGSTGHGQG